MRRTRTGAALLAGVAVAALAGCGSGTATGGGRGSTPPSATAASTTLHAASTSAGTVLVDASGRTLYAFARDSVGRSTCTGSCATYWPPEPAGDLAGTHPPGVGATLGSLTRPDGSAQLTVNGYPAYRFSGDSAPGQANGQGVNASGGLWWALSPDGSWITATSAPATSSSSPSGRSY